MCVFCVWSVVFCVFVGTSEMQQVVEWRPCGIAWGPLARLSGATCGVFRLPWRIPLRNHAYAMQTLHDLLTKNTVFSSLFFLVGDNYTSTVLLSYMSDSAANAYKRCALQANPSVFNVAAMLITQ